MKLKHSLVFGTLLVSIASGMQTNPLNVSSETMEVDASGQDGIQHLNRQADQSAHAEQTDESQTEAEKNPGQLKLATKTATVRNQTASKEDASSAGGSDSGQVAGSEQNQSDKARAGSTPADALAEFAADSMESVWLPSVQQTSRVVTEGKKEVETVSASMFVACDRSEVYAYPSSQAEQTGSVGLNTRAEVVSAGKDGWYQVEVQGKKGFMKADSLSESEIKTSTLACSITRNDDGSIKSLEWDDPADYCQWDVDGFYDGSRWHGNWGGVVVNGYTIGATACVITSTCNVISTLSGERTDVAAVSKAAGRAGYLNNNQAGAEPEGAIWTARQHGLHTEIIPTAAEAAEALKAGKCIVALEKPSPFYWGGNHAVSFFGYKDGKTRVMDPAHPERDERDNIGGQWYGLDYLWGYSQGYGSWIAMWSDEVEDLQSGRTSA